MNDSLTEIILESISDGVFTVDPEWRITSFNRAAETITGISRRDAIGKPCWEVFKSNLCEMECPLRNTMKSGRPLINKPGYIIDPKGRKLPVTISTALLKDRDGAVIGGAETFRDVSEVEQLRQELQSRYSFGEMRSNSSAMARIFEILPAISSSDSTILVEGETGTGKELLARTIHAMSGRAKSPFVAVNCGALPDTLLESELFGYKKGAFTGADRDKPGRFALADQGTLFLDEIGEISPALQVRLLRVLQEREYEPLGATRSQKTNVRIIGASNRNLKAMMDSGSFRQDLYYRIRVISLEIPPLRNRQEDIPGLVNAFIRKFNHTLRKSITGVSPEVYAAFYSHPWPGNIRELENVIERAMVLCPNKTIGPEYLPAELLTSSSIPTSHETLKTREHQTQKLIILRTLAKHHYNQTAAAHELGIHPSTLFRKIRSLKIIIPKSSPH
ncbi:MAG: sigma 54-interacting transcriptional regulator [Candidatus Delongbacteria bacterium]|nr:sigma 54-interacting transcriptional regulator [Candidatus Delongbacteria bacterium]